MPSLRAWVPITRSTHPKRFRKGSGNNGGRGADLVLDQLIGPDFTDSIPMLAPLGTIVSFALAGLPEEIRRDACQSG